jgi:hypothetical protein
MTQVSRDGSASSSWARNPRVLGKVGVTLVVVSAAILWVVSSKQPEPLPDSLQGLERVSGTLERIVEDFRPQYTSRQGRRTIVHQRKQRGWLLTLKPAAGQSLEWSVASDEPALAALAPGAAVTAVAQDGHIYQLETSGRVLVDLEQTRAELRSESVLALSIVGLAFVAGLVTCGMAYTAWRKT